PADAVELVEDAREAAGLALALVPLLVGGVAHAGREGDPRRIRRPLDGFDALLQVGELARLAAFGRDDVERGGRLVVAARRGEREPRAVRRPARSRVSLPAGGEGPGVVRAVRRRE